MAYNYEPNPSPGGGDNNDNSDLFSWIVVVAALVIFWPVGLFLLFRKLMGYSVGKNAYDRREQRRHPYDMQQDQAAGPYKASESKSQSSASYSQSASQSAKRQDASGRTGYKYEYRYQYQSGAGGAQSAPGAPQASNPPRQERREERRDTRRDTRQPGMQGVPYQQSRRRNVNLNKGKGMTVWGWILTGIFGLGALTSIPQMLFMGNWGALFGAGAPILGFLCLGLVLLYTGGQRNKKAKRFRKYLALIGKRDSIAISSLAQAMPVSYHTACDDLQEMLDEGYIPTGYLDMGSGRLILSDAGLNEEAPAEPEPEEEEPEIETVEEPGRTVEDDNAILADIRQVNDAIADPEMSRKIDRIAEITGKILDYQRKNPNKNSQLRSFLSYYLPTTLKILKAYAQMEAQGIEGENIRAAKERIEGMMDKVVEGFEKQLDKLFQDDAMDITTDVEVLERMLDKDGLSGGEGGFQLGI